MTFDDMNKLANKLLRLGLDQTYTYDTDGDDYTIVWNDGVTPPDQATLDATPDFPVVRVVSSTQGLLALDQAGLYDQVDAAMTAHPVRAARIWYTRAPNWEWADTYLQAMAMELKLDDLAVDKLFYAASQF